MQSSALSLHLDFQDQFVRKVNADFEVVQSAKKFECSNQEIRKKKIMGYQSGIEVELWAKTQGSSKNPLKNRLMALPAAQEPENLRREMELRWRRRSNIAKNSRDFGNSKSEIS